MRYEGRHRQLGEAPAKFGEASAFSRMENFRTGEFGRKKSRMNKFSSNKFRRKIFGRKFLAPFDVRGAAKTKK